MAFIGRKPTNAPLTSSDLGTGIVGSTNIADGTIVNADVNSSAAIAYSKLSLANSIAIADFSATGTPSSTTFLRGDNTWGSAGAAAGQVIQVLSATDSTKRTTSSTSFVTASNTLSVTITPSSASNKIFIMVNTGAWAQSSADSTCIGTIYRGATNLALASGSDAFGVGAAGIGSLGIDGRGILSMSFLDSPATTSATTYQVYFKSDVSNASINETTNASSTTGSITVMEIKG